MPLAHTCTSCGLDLSRIAAPLDPIYRLPIVVCPECRAAVVRRSDGHRWLSRDRNRTLLAVRNLLGVPVSWLLIVGLVLTPALLTSDLLRHAKLGAWFAAGQLIHITDRDDRYAMWSDDLGPFLLVCVGAAGAAGCVYAMLVLPHLRRRVVVPLFVCSVLLALFLPGTIEWGVRWIDSAIDGRSVRPFRRQFRRQFREELGALEVLTIAAVAAPLGIPLAHRIRRMAERVGHRRQRKLRKRLRKRRQGS